MQFITCSSMLPHTFHAITPMADVTGLCSGRLGAGCLLYHEVYFCRLPAGAVPAVLAAPFPPPCGCTVSRAITPAPLDHTALVEPRVLGNDLRASCCGAPCGWPNARPPALERRDKAEVGLGEVGVLGLHLHCLSMCSRQARRRASGARRRRACPTIAWPCARRAPAADHMPRGVHVPTLPFSEPLPRISSCTRRAIVSSMRQLVARTSVYLLSASSGPSWPTCSRGCST